MNECQLEHICHMRGGLRNPPEVIGETAEGIRANFYVTGGEITGSRLNGKVLPVGGDWLTLRRDGVGILDVRATLETDDGAPIYLSYTGILEMGEDGYQRFLAGDMPRAPTIRGAPRFLTAHPDYQWLNRLQCVNVGGADLEEYSVSYDIYALK
jgi:hypothetical protein